MAGVSVVSYRNSTSNHNKVVTRPLGGRVVSYRNSTSNHNWKSSMVFSSLLYLIEILHQTTTAVYVELMGRALYLIEILHQTTTAFLSTLIGFKLYLIEILHQTTTRELAHMAMNSCILSKFYIKPQRG